MPERQCRLFEPIVPLWSGAGCDEKVRAPARRVMNSAGSGTLKSGKAEASGRLRSVGGDDWLRRVIRDYMLTRSRLKALSFASVGVAQPALNRRVLSIVVEITIEERIDGGE